MEISLRPYQRQMISMIYNELKSKSNVIGHLQTGGGKTITFIAMIQELMKCNCHVVVVMRRRSLIFQTSQQFDKFGVEHGVYMSGHKRYAPTKSVQICSIDTLGARELYPHENKGNVVVVLDESHDVTPTGRKYAQLVKRYEGKKIVGFTATPYTDNSLFESVVCPISAADLMTQGYLVPAKIYAPDIIDTTNVAVNRMGKFDQDQLFDACTKSQIVGDIVKNWKKYGQNRRTILFAVNVEHSKLMCEAFNNAGIKAAHCDADTKQKDRDRILRQVREGEIKILCNVNVFSTGLDLVELECIIFARPTRSLVYYLQAVGRGLRTSDHTGKTDCIIIDSAGNSVRFGSPYKEREVILGKRKAEKGDIEDINVRVCKQCSFMFKATQQTCPDCGFTNPKVERKGYEEVDGELVEIKLSEAEIDALKRANLSKGIRQWYHIQRKNKKLGEWFVERQARKIYDDEFITKNGDMISRILKELKGKYEQI